VLVEGFLDLHQLRARGIENIAALGGTPTGTRTSVAVHRLGIEAITLCLDSDEAGRPATARDGERASRCLFSGRGRDRRWDVLVRRPCTVVVRRYGSALISALVNRSVTHCLREKRAVWSRWWGETGLADSEKVSMVRVRGFCGVSSIAMMKLEPKMGVAGGLPSGRGLFGPGCRPVSPRGGPIGWPGSGPVASMTLKQPFSPGQPGRAIPAQRRALPAGGLGCA
jgi:hypothetical protein